MITKKLQIITHPSTLQSARKIPTHNANPLTTVQPVNSILTMTNLLQGGCFYISYWPKSLMREDSQCDRARVAKPHPQQQQLFPRNGQRDQQHGIG
jgi:hypothetical protein